MKCAACGGKTLVVNSRHTTGGEVWRRRQCVARCSARFQTIEARVLSLDPDDEHGTKIIWEKS